MESKANRRTAQGDVNEFVPTSEEMESAQRKKRRWPLAPNA
jgi:hypothetical protein